MEKKYKQTKNFILRTIANESFLFPIENMPDKTQGAIILNEISKYIWGFLEAPRTFDEILKNITENYDVLPQDATTDINLLLAQFTQYGVIQII